MKTPMQLHPTMKGELRAGALHLAATAPEGFIEMSSKTWLQAPILWNTQ